MTTTKHNKAFTTIVHYREETLDPPCTARTKEKIIIKTYLNNNFYTKEMLMNLILGIMYYYSKTIIVKLLPFQQYNHSTEQFPDLIHI